MRLPRDAFEIVEEYDGGVVFGDGHVKLSDFGVSEEFEDEEDQLRRTAGTPSFTAPELITAGQPKARGRKVDMFAVGVTLYCLCFSCTPFKGANIMEVYDQIRTHDVTMPDGTNPALVALIQGLLNRDPQERLSVEQALESEWLAGTFQRK